MKIEINIHLPFWRKSSQHRQRFEDLRVYPEHFEATKFRHYSRALHPNSSSDDAHGPLDREVILEGRAPAACILNLEQLDAGPLTFPHAVLQSRSDSG
jgi:hypothetical protein